MDLSAIIYKNVSKCCTVQKSTQINHRNIHTKYSIFSACAVCQFVTYTPAQGSARKQYIPHYLLLICITKLSLSACITSILYFAQLYSVIHSYLSCMTLLSKATRVRMKQGHWKKSFNQDVLLNFHNIPVSRGILSFYLILLSHITAFCNFSLC